VNHEERYRAYRSFSFLCYAVGNMTFMDNLAFTTDDLYEEVKTKAREEGAMTREAWHEIVDEVLDDKTEFQEMDDDEDLAQLREALQARYSDFEAETEVM
jgi:hypothetical protein